MLHYIKRYKYLFFRLQIISFFLFLVNSSVIEAATTVSPTIYQRTVRLTSMTRARAEMMLSSEVSGKCEQVHAEVGEPIPAINAFAQIDTTFVDLDIKSNGIEQQKLRRQLENEQVALKRYTQLKKTNATTQARFDEVRLSADIHKIELENLKIHQIHLNEMRQRHTITAPAGWLVIERMIEPGELVQAGQNLAKIGDFSQLIVTYALGFKELQTLKKSPSVQLYLPEGQITLPAQLYTISPSYDPKTRKVPVELILMDKQKNDLQPVRGGMRAELALTIEDNEQTFELPRSAVISKYDTHWVIRENNTKLQVILLGTTESGKAIITSSELTPRDQLLTKPETNF